MLPVCHSELSVQHVLLRSFKSMGKLWLKEKDYNDMRPSEEPTETQLSSPGEGSVVNQIDRKLNALL